MDYYFYEYYEYKLFGFIVIDVVVFVIWIGVMFMVKWKLFIEKWRKVWWGKEKIDGKYWFIEVKNDGVDEIVFVFIVWLVYVVIIFVFEIVVIFKRFVD